jgi:hypothetical protein
VLQGALPFAQAVRNRSSKGANTMRDQYDLDPALPLEAGVDDSAELSIEDLEAVASAALLNVDSGAKSLHGIGNAPM